jgi:AcrR family transcriptional regulator
MTRKLARKRKSKSEKLLDAALELFSAKGYAEVTMQGIAQRAGTTYSLMYYYYKNKEDLFHAAISHSIDQTIESYNSLQVESDSPVDLINDWLENNIKLSESLKRVVKIMFEFSEKREGSPTVQKDIVYFYEFERKVIADSIRLGVERGIFTCADPDATATFVSSHIDGIFYGALVRPGMDIEAAMRELKSVLWTLLDYRPSSRRRKLTVA